MKSLKSLLFSVLAPAALISPSQAALVTFTSVNQTGSILFATSHDGAVLNGLVDFKLTSINATTAIFDVSVKNNSSGAGANTFTSFGIDVVAPTLVGATATGSWGATTSANYFNKVDLCVWAGNNCSGGGNNGIAIGATSLFTLTLTTLDDDDDFATSGVSFTSPYFAKFQSVGTSGQSYEFAGCVPNAQGSCEGGGGGATGGSVPEPATLGLVGLALLGVAGLRRRSA